MLCYAIILPILHFAHSVMTHLKHPTIAFISMFRKFKLKVSCGLGFLVGTLLASMICVVEFVSQIPENNVMSCKVFCNVLLRSHNIGIQCMVLQCLRMSVPL